MKKITLLSAGIAIVLLSSCVRTRDCECVDTDDQYTVVYTVVGTKATAAEDCDDYDATYSTYSTECELKD